MSNKVVTLTDKKTTQAFTTCQICKAPFQYKAKICQETGMPEIKQGHPKCFRYVNKMDRLNERIEKTKATLHTLRTQKLNLEFEKFISGSTTIDPETDEIFLILKEKGIMPTT